MNSREWILKRVRERQPDPVALPVLPDFASPPEPLAARFATALARMGGSYVVLPPGMSVEAFITERYPEAEVVASATTEVRGTRDVRAGHDPKALEDVDVGVVRAAFGVAETGSVWLSESELAVNAIAFLSQHLLVLLDPEAIVPGLQEAYRDPRFALARYAVLLTGPSATADIEGVLVRGAQGVRSLTVVARAAPAA